MQRLSTLAVGKSVFFMETNQAVNISDIESYRFPVIAIQFCLYDATVTQSHGHRQYKVLNPKMSNKTALRKQAGVDPVKGRRIKRP